MDGDGELSVMWVEDPNGEFKLTLDGRRFVRIADPREPGTRFRRIGAEGFDNDGDGRINEDDLGGPDPNRNFPFGWTLQDGWPYPMSENETRNVFEFQLKHPNIFASFHYHNTGRLIMFMAPPDTRTSLSAEQRAAQEANVAARLAEMRKTDRYAQLFPRVPPPDMQNDMDTQLAVVTEGANILKDYTPTFSGLSGQAQASSYNMLGAFSYLIELWGPPPIADVDRNADGRMDEDEQQAWFQTELTGEGWILPHKVKHSRPRRHLDWRQREETHRADAACALRGSRGAAPDAVRALHREPVPEDRAGEGQGDAGHGRPVLGRRHRAERPGLPDVLGPRAAARAGGARQLTLAGSQNVTVVDLPAGPVRLDPGNEQAVATALGAKPAEFRLRGRDSIRFRGLVKMTGAEGWIELKTESKFGGTDTRRVAMKVSGS